MNHANISTEFRNYAIASNAMANLTLLKMTHPDYFLDNFTWIGNGETLFCLDLRLANHRNSSAEIDRIYNLHFGRNSGSDTERNLLLAISSTLPTQGLSSAERAAMIRLIRHNMSTSFRSTLENYQERLDLVAYHARRAASPVIRGF